MSSRKLESSEILPTVKQGAKSKQEVGFMQEAGVKMEAAARTGIKQGMAVKQETVK